MAYVRRSFRRNRARSRYSGVSRRVFRAPARRTFRRRR